MCMAASVFPHIVVRITALVKILDQKNHGITVSSAPCKHSVGESVFPFAAQYQGTTFN